MNRHSEAKLFVIVAATTILGFLLSIAAEWEMASTGARIDAARLESSLYTRALREQRLAGASSAVERQIAELNLASSAAKRTGVLMQTLERVSAACGILIVSVQHESVTVSPREVPSKQLRADGYVVALRGAYPDVLRALAGLARAPIVTRLVAVSFERVRPPRNPGEDVQATVELAVFALKKHDAGA